MSLISITDVQVLNQFSSFSDVFQFKIAFKGGSLIELRLVDFMSHKNFVFPPAKTKLKPMSFICGKLCQGSRRYWLL